MKKGIFALLATFPLQAQQPEIRQINVLPTGEPRLEVDSAEDFLLEATNDLQSSSWVILGESTSTPLSGSTWQVDPLESLQARQFFRVAPLTPLEITAEVVEGGDLVVSIGDSSGPRPYRGLLDYQIAFLGIPGQPPLTGQVLIDGSTFSLALPDLNDSSADFSRSLTLILTSPDGNSLGRLTLGDSQIRTFAITDNDASWAGIMIDASDQSELPLHLFVTDGTQAVIKTDEASFLPPNSAPASDGAWPAAFLTSSPEIFETSFGPIPLPSGDNQLLPPTELTLELNGVEAGITSDTITGTFTLTTSAPTAPHLVFVPRTGEFTLRKAVAIPPAAVELSNVE